MKRKKPSPGRDTYQDDLRARRRPPRLHRRHRQIQESFLE
jgi:hypothetical protein